jgi:uncharacterized membrane protein
MEPIIDFFNTAGSLICHQLPSRTLTCGGLALPVCARDTGIYAGIFTSMLFLILFRRLGSQKPPGIASSVLMCLTMLPMILDGFLSYTGVIQTNNTVRLFTGVLFGLPIPIFLVPLAHFKSDGKNESAVFRNGLEPAAVYLATLLLCFLLVRGRVPYIAASLIFITAFLFLLSRMAYTVLKRMGRLRPKALYTATCGATLCLLALLYTLSFFVL